MNNYKYLFCLTAVLSCFTIPVKAELTVTSGGNTPVDGSFLTTSNPSATVIDFDSVVPGGFYQYTGGDIVGPGTIGSVFATPANDTTKYFSVGPSTSDPSTIITIDGLQEYFGLYWGSIDTYNTISFFNDNTLVQEFTGTDLSNLGIGIVPDGNQFASNSNVYLNFQADSSSYFNKIVFTSNGENAFESDNHAFLRVFEPEPNNPRTVPESSSLLGVLFFGGLRLVAKVKKNFY